MRASQLVAELKRLMSQDGDLEVLALTRTDEIRHVDILHRQIPVTTSATNYNPDAHEHVFLLRCWEPQHHYRPSFEVKP